MTENERTILKYIFEKFNRQKDHENSVLFSLPDYDFFKCKTDNEIINFNSSLRALHDQGFIIYPNYETSHVRGGWLKVTTKTFNYFSNGGIN